MRRHWPLLPIAALALALRVLNLDFGLPELAHVDEWRVVASASKLARSRPLDLDPGSYNYPALQLYVHAAQLAVADRVAPPEGGLTGRAGVNRDARLGRRITVAFSVATVLATWALGWLVAGAGGAVLAALFLAVAPFPAYDSHYVNVDTPLTFWLVCAVCAALVHLRSGRSAWLWVAAACVGAAAGTKYTGGAAVLLLPVACLLARREGEAPGRTLLLTALAGAAALASFLVLSPYTALEFRAFASDFLAERSHVAEMGHEGFDLDAEGWIYRPLVYQLAAGLPLALGLPLYLLALVGVAGALRRPARETWLILGATLPLFAVVVSARVVFVRYLLPLLPFLALAAAGPVLRGLRSPARGARLAAAVALGAVLLYTTVFTLSQLRALDPHNAALAAAWVRENVPRGDRVDVVGAPWMLQLPDAEYRVGRFNLERSRRAREFPTWLVVSGWAESAAERAGRRRARELSFLRSLGSADSRYETQERFQSTYFGQALYARLDPVFANQFQTADFSIHRLRETKPDSD